MGAELAFVVIGRNEGQRLERCLASLRPNSSRVVYSDSASTDGSAELAERAGAIVVRLTDSEPLSAARGRNAGFAAVRAHFPECAFVQFLDGDCVLAPGWDEAAQAFLEANPRAAVACGRRFEADPEASLYNRLCDDEWNTPIGPAQSFGGDAMIRVSALEQVGGYRADLRAGEEPELAARLRSAGWQIWRLDLPMSEHDAAIHRFSQWWRRALRSGFGYAQVWSVMRSPPERIYGRELRSAFFWTIGFPVIIVVAALLFGNPVLLLGLAVGYALQIARIAWRRVPSSIWSWRYAAMTMLAKVPETLGALRYFTSGSAASIGEYKT